MDDRMKLKIVYLAIAGIGLALLTVCLHAANRT